jgi:hypothetical protein
MSAIGALSNVEAPLEAACNPDRLIEDRSGRGHGSVFLGASVAKPGELRGQEPELPDQLPKAPQLLGREDGTSAPVPLKPFRGI